MEGIPISHLNFCFKRSPPFWLAGEPVSETIRASLSEREDLLQALHLADGAAEPDQSAGVFSELLQHIGQRQWPIPVGHGFPFSP